MNGSVSSSYKYFGEAANVKAPDTRFAIIAASKEFNTGVRVVGEEIGNLLS